MRATEFVFENDEEHFKTLEKTGFWGSMGAGCIFYAKDTNKYLIAKRSQYVEQPNTWGTWGGAIDQSETPEQAVLREIREETGYSGSVQLKPLWTFKHPNGFQYFNFLAIVEREFEPKLDWETQDYKWVEKGDWPQPLHFGLESLIKNSILGN